MLRVLVVTHYVTVVFARPMISSNAAREEFEQLKPKSGAENRKARGVKGGGRRPTGQPNPNEAETTRHGANKYTRTAVHLMACAESLAACDI